MHSETLLDPPRPPHHGCALVQVRKGEGGAVAARRPLFPLVRRLRLLPLNHAAAHDAVEAPQIEEGDGAEQPHGDDLSSTSGDML